MSRRASWKRDESPYYDPWMVTECEHGHSDGDLFPRNR